MNETEYNDHWDTYCVYDIEDHTMKLRDKSRPFPCPYCGELFADPTDFLYLHEHQDSSLSTATN